MITILGYNCVLCGFFYSVIKETAQKKGWQVDVVYSKDKELMAAHQIENTPAILLDDKVICAGCRSTKRALGLLEEILKTGVFPPEQKNIFQGEIK